MKNHLIKGSLVIAGLIVIGSLGFRIVDTWFSGEEQTAQLPATGSLGGTHQHMSMLIFINDTRRDLSGDQYMDRASDIHFHDNDGIFIHTHARGMTLPYFLGSLGITLSKGCLIVAETPYCNDKERHLTIMINKIRANDWIDEYELADTDKILITYGGDESELAIALKYNSIPDLPKDLSYDTFNQTE